MNPTIYAIALVGALSLVVVSADIDQSVIEKAKKNYKEAVDKMPSDEMEAVSQFREMVLAPHGDIFDVDDAFFEVSEVAFSRAIGGYLTYNSGPYESSDEQKFVEDFNNQLVKPCETLKSIYGEPTSFYEKKDRSNDNKEYIHAIKQEGEVYDLLEAAAICDALIEDAEIKAKKAFKFVQEHKPRAQRPRSRIEGPVQDEDESEDQVEDTGNVSEVSDDVGAEDRLNDGLVSKLADEVHHDTSEEVKHEIPEEVKHEVLEGVTA